MVPLISRLGNSLRSLNSGIQRAKKEHAQNLVPTEWAKVYAVKLFYVICKDDERFSHILSETPEFITAWRDFFFPRLDKALNQPERNIQDKGLRALLVDCIDIEYMSMWRTFESNTPWVRRPDSDLLLLGASEEGSGISSKDYADKCNNLHLVSSMSSFITLGLLKHHLDDDVLNFVQAYRPFSEATERSHATEKLAVLRSGKEWPDENNRLFIGATHWLAEPFLESCLDPGATQAAIAKLKSLTANG